MNNTQKALIDQEICEQTTPNLGITQSSGLDHHAVFSRQRVDLFTDGEVASTQSARQYKDVTPLECERLQGFPDGWTALPGASDSARYRALGNSVYWDKAIMLMMGTKMA